MNTNCPACGKGLTTFFLLSRWNPYLFQCPHCHASLAFPAASKGVAVGMALGLVMVAIGIYLEEIKVIPKFGGLAFVLFFSIAPLLFVHSVLARHGRLRVGRAPAKSEHQAARYNYILVIVLPTFLLLVIGVGAVTVSGFIRPITPEHYAKQEMVLEQLKTRTLPSEKADHLIASGIKADRAHDRFIQSIKGLLSFMGVAITAFAAWLLFGGYMAFRRPNKALQNDGVGQ
jgi:hypothetical protein